MPEDASNRRISVIVQYVVKVRGKDTDQTNSKDGEKPAAESSGISSEKPDGNASGKPAAGKPEQK
jgi:hypothetical protein